MSVTGNNTVSGNNYKVRLISVTSLKNGSINDPDQVSFDVTPSFSESGSVDYAAITPVHMPGGIQVYKRTNSRTFTIGAKLISRTVAEATQNMQYLQTLRAWRFPYFGINSSKKANEDRVRAQTNSQDSNVSAAQQNKGAIATLNSSSIELLGAPPPVLYLYAYSTSANDDRPTAYGVNINRVPVVLSDLSITYPDDVDCLPISSSASSVTINGSSEPFPIRVDVSITLLETHSPAEFEQFSLQKYKTGQLVNF